MANANHGICKRLYKRCYKAQHNYIPQCCPEGDSCDTIKILYPSSKATILSKSLSKLERKYLSATNHSLPWEPQEVSVRPILYRSEVGLKFRTAWIRFSTT
jgi:hypothetical protein